MNFILWTLIYILGLCWGSFLNVVIVRSLKGESIIFPASKCPKCDVPLLWWQNIPIVSFFYLKGRCVFCNAPISIQYPIIECLGLIIFIFSFSRYISLYDALSVIAILSMFLTLSTTDIKEQKVSKLQAFIIMGAGIVFNRYNIINAIMGGLIGAAIIAILTQAGLKLLKKETFGVGDIYLLGALGTVVGLDRLYIFIIYALFLQIAFILPSYSITLWKNKQTQTLKYLTLFVVTCLFLYVIRNICFIGSIPLFIVVLGIILYLAYKLTKNLFTILKKQETQSYCPLAPAIAVSCLIYLL